VAIVHPNNHPIEGITNKEPNKCLNKSAEEICNVVGDLVRIGELAIAAQKSTDYYCNESTIQPSEEDWRIDGTEEHKLWNAMEADIAALRAAIDTHLSSPNTRDEPRSPEQPLSPER